MFLKKIIFSKKSLLIMIFSLIIPFFDPYYNLKIIDHTFLSFKIWFALLLMFLITIYLFNKIYK